MDIKKLIGKRVLERRLFLNWSQDKLKEMSGVDKAQISKIENGTSLPGLETILKFGKAMNISVDYFIQDIDGYEPLCPGESEMIYQFRSIDKKYQEMIREYIELLSNKNK